MMRLGGPLKSTMRADTEIKGSFKYSAACHMLGISRGKRCISRAKGKLYYCSDCKVFDEFVAPYVMIKLFEVEKALEYLDVDYLKDWRFMCNDCGWSDEDYPRHESSEYMTELCKYIETKHEASVLEGQEHGQLRVVEASAATLWTRLHRRWRATRCIGVCVSHAIQDGCGYTTQWRRNHSR